MSRIHCSPSGRIHLPYLASIFSLIVVLALVAGAAPVAAQVPSIGIYLDEAGTVVSGEMVAGTPFDIYVFAFHPPSTVLHYDFDLISSVPPDFVLSQESPFLSEPMDPDLHFDVDLPECAAGSEKVLLGHAVVLYFIAHNDVYWCLAPVDGKDAPSWMECDSTVVALPPAWVDPSGDMPGGCLILNSTQLPPEYPPSAFPIYLEPQDVAVAPDQDFSEEIATSSVVLVSTQPPSSKASYVISTVSLHLSWDQSVATLQGVRQGLSDLDWTIDWQPDPTGVAVTITAGNDDIPHWNDPLLYLDLHSGAGQGSTPVTIDSSYAEYSDGAECPSSGGTATLSVATVAVGTASWGVMKAQYGE